MNQAVVLKANNFGLLIVLDPELEFDKLKEAVADKFKESSAFFGTADMAVSFEGRKLSAEEEDILLTVILENASFKISCVIDNDEEKEKLFKEHVEHMEKSKDLRFAIFHRGNFRSGQMMEFDSGVVIIGDINPGAKVIAKGNILILGSLKGEAEAGAGGDDRAFIIALDMQPIQLRIGTKIARSSDGSSFKRNREKSALPQIAFVEDDNIYIEDLDKKVLDSLYLPG